MKRSVTPELLDTDSGTPAEVAAALADLRRINRWFGGIATTEEMVEIEQHLAECGECRDLVLFIRKTNATLQYEGRVSRVAKALGISVEQLNREIHLGTSIAALVKRPPEAPVSPPGHEVQPLSPTKK